MSTHADPGKDLSIGLIIGLVVVVVVAVVVVVVVVPLDQERLRHLR